MSSDQFIASCRKRSKPGDVRAVALWALITGTIESPEAGLPVPVPVNEAALAEIAAATGGRFFQAATTSELIAIFTAIGSTS